MTLVMIIPSRGRPDAAREAADSAAENRSRTDTEVIIAVDGDPDARYSRATTALGGISVERDPVHRGMVRTLNAVATRVVRSRFVTHVGFMGDDHRVHTPGWDTELMKSAGPVGVAYADDLNPNVDLPTSVVLGANLVRTIGCMAPNVLGHLYVDDFWRELGLRLGRLAYRPDIVIEHMHPSVGKGEWDDQYRRVNSPEQFERDAEIWRSIRDGGALDIAVNQIRRAYPGEFVATRARNWQRRSA